MTHAVEDAEKQNHSSTSSVKVQWDGCSGNSSAIYLKGSTLLPYEPALALRDIYAGGLKTYVHTKIKMSVAVLFKTAQN